MDHLANALNGEWELNGEPCHVSVWPQHIRVRMLPDELGKVRYFDRPKEREVVVYDNEVLWKYSPGPGQKPQIVRFTR